MTLNNLSSLVSYLKSKKKLYEIQELVSPTLEMTEIADRIYQSKDKSYPILFTNNSTPFPVLINIFANEELTRQYVRWDEVAPILENFSDLFKLKFSRSSFLFLKRFMKSKPYKRRCAPCQEVVSRELGFFDLPILQCWPNDAGRYITLPLVHTIDPETGIQNIGMYRMQIYDNKTAGLHWHIHKGGAEHFQKWKEMKKRMPVTITLGGAPALIYAATAPLPQGIPEYAFASFLLNKRIHLVKCISNDILIPADSEIVLEGFVEPEEELRMEGPFGDHTGFYSIPDYYPVFHLELITHRKKAIYPATVVGIPPKEDEQLGHLTTQIFTPIIKQTLLPELIDLYLPTEGGFHNLALTSIHETFPGQAEKVAHAIWGIGLLSLTKIILVFDDDIHLRNWSNILSRIDRSVAIPDDILFSKGPLDVLDHSAQKFAYGGKLAILATSKFKSNHMFDMNTYELPFIHLWLTQRIAIIYHDHFEDVLTWLKQHSLHRDKFYVVMEKRWYSAKASLQLWFGLSTLDPVRDLHFIQERFSLVINCLSYGKTPSPFNTSWPEMVLMDEKTINTIDQKWSSFNFDFFTESPSAILRKEIEQ
ncbi:MAG: menaquinone biosynthesis decarboxylase [Bacteroidales bacterium]|nr:menaquinone biosynthesis decarboxylase [Bacteroidales bacterium]